MQANAGIGCREKRNIICFKLYIGFPHHKQELVVFNRFVLTGTFGMLDKKQINLEDV